MKNLTGILLVLIVLGFSTSSVGWARGGSSGGTSLSGGGGGSGAGFSGGGNFRGGGGHFRGGSHFRGSRSHFGGGHRHFRHSHNRYNFRLGIGGFYGPGFYGPAYYGTGFYGYPYYYGYRSRYYYPRSYGYPSSIIAPASRPVYIQREASVAATTQQQTNYWYYCRNPEGYYPYVKQCPEGWLQVAPQPTPQ